MQRKKQVGKENRIRNIVYLIIAFGALVRLFLAAFLELGNDEVYYITYARYPDLSHFDHPPMVGWFISFFSGNLSLCSELFIRFSSIVIFSLNALLIFRIVRKLADERAGLISVILYHTSFYAFIITGVFILPDTPVSVFWILSLWFFIQAFEAGSPLKKQNSSMFFAGVVVGLAMLSKYHAVSLWFAAIVFILISRREWLKRPVFYLSGITSILIFLPVLYWNYQNEFISFAFHGARVGHEQTGIRWDYVQREFLGQLGYNNPFNIAIYAILLFAFFRQLHKNIRSVSGFLVLTAIPLIIVFLLLSFTKKTLPHWSGPGYYALMMMAGVFYAKHSRKFLKVLVIAACIASFLVIPAGFIYIHTGILHPDQSQKPDYSVGRKDVTLDLYGWKQVSEKFAALRKKDIEEGKMPADAILMTNKWFPAGHIDYYIARPLGLKLFVMGKLENIHKYYWINQIDGVPPDGSSAYYISTSRAFSDPGYEYKDYFSEISQREAIPIIRSGKHAGNVFVYRMKNAKALPCVMKD
ncbi:MAG: glycosyltransferase family 39 protein [Bacteroidetes bacterium]|nr:glycosyltransferase family 39 protein [Bacteroidota bacterium]MBU1717768.1 glycosyltransferase family 39 protein [Bacteroidota bacterium]